MHNKKHRIDVKTLHTALFIALGTATSAQTVGLDFTADDCGGASHHLFSDLDAGYAVVLDFVMMNCPDCAPATVAIAQDVIPNTTDPARVKFYSIGFDDMITCPEITSWATDGGITHPLFAGMSDQTAYYGGMGMPTIVVLGGGSTHGVYYQHLGYMPGLNGIITSAINLALAEAIGLEENAARAITLGPNPVMSTLVLNGSYVAATVTDMQGRVVIRATDASSNSLDVGTLPSGPYIVELIAADKSHAVGRFEKL